MSNKVEKFREPLGLYPTGLGARAQDMFALVLRELSKLSGHNRKELVKASKNEDYSPKILPIPESCVFSEEEIMRVFDCSAKDIARTLHPAARSLTTHPVDLKAGIEGDFDEVTLLRRAKYTKGGELEILIEEDIAKILYEEIGERFSEMDLKLFISLSGKYERRLLKLLSKWRGLSQGAPKMKFEDYRQELGIPDGKYTRPDFFRNRCIVDPIKDIIEKSDGMWIPTDPEGKGYQLFKTGRKFTHVRFCLDWRPNEISVTIAGDEEREKTILELEQTEQIILALPVVPELISKPYLDKAKEFGHKIPYEVKSKIESQGDSNCEDIPY